MSKKTIFISVLLLGMQSSTALGAAGTERLSQWWQNRNKNAGFVLPYYYNSKTKHRYYIFGREKGGPDRGTYSMFGGSARQGEGHPVVTAAREGVEEFGHTLGLNQQTMQKLIDISQSGHTTAIIATTTQTHSGKHALAIYLTQFGEKDIKNQLLPRFKGNREIDLLVEVREDRLKNALKSAQPNKPITVESTVWSNGRSLGNQQITLRPIAVHLKPYFGGNMGKLGQDKKIHFYN